MAIAKKTMIALGAATLASLPVATAIGCYEPNKGLFGNDLGGTTFNMLHSSPSVDGSQERDLRNEVIGDIASTCRMVTGSIVGPGQSWKRCSDWAYEAYEFTCSQNCELECPGDSRSTSPYGLCDAGWECRGRCPTEPTDDGSSISWEIAHDGNGDDTRTMNFEDCRIAFEGASLQCPRGGEFNHQGFWYKIDPNPLKCDAKGFFKSKRNAAEWKA